MREGQSSWFFKLISLSKTKFLLVCYASHTCGYHLLSVKNMHSGLLRLVKETTLTYSIFVGHGYLQHGVRGWQDPHSPRYHTNFNRSTYKVKDAVASPILMRFQTVKQPAPGSRKTERNMVWKEREDPAESPKRDIYRMKIPIRKHRIYLESWLRNYCC